LIGKYPVTNAQYERFLKSDDFANPDFWMKFPKFDENCQLIGDWSDEGWQWLKERLKDYEFFPPEMWKVEPEYWQHQQFGVAQPNNPVVGVTWYEANAYCKWLSAHWRELPESAFLSSFILSNSSFVFRLPLETEWVAAAGGNKPEGRYPWDLPGRITTDVKEIIQRANVVEKISYTTPVNRYSNGKSPFGVMDMAGNVWEWQANYYYKDNDWPAWRGGSWINALDDARVSARLRYNPSNGDSYLGFRVVFAPHL
jgi:formylglycine-generating enzyme required for sulfatase activity